MTHVACESKLRPFVWSPMHSWPKNVAATGRVVVNYTRAAHAFSAGIECWHCKSRRNFDPFFNNLLVN